MSPSTDNHFVNGDGDLKLLPHSNAVDQGYPTDLGQIVRYQVDPGHDTHMANDFIDTRTNALRESHIVQRTRIRISVDARLMADCVELIRRDSRLDE